MKDHDGFCACGCGARTKTGRHIRGHAMKGDTHYAWRGGRSTNSGYHIVQRPNHPRAVNGYVREHILIAEKALGKPLPLGAQVHHVDMNRLNNASNNLVICQDNAYHFLLHTRARAKAACGNANWLRCLYCSSYSDPAVMHHVNGRRPYHRECHNQYERAQRAKKRMKRG